MEFFLSPGFGGAAAVIAASIAYAAARWRGKVDRQLGERAAWWARAQWALDRTRDEDRYSQLLGWNALTTLVEAAPTDEDAQLVDRAAEAAEEAYTAEVSVSALPGEEDPDERRDDITDAGTDEPRTHG